MSLLANGFVAAGDEVLLITIASMPNSDCYRLEPRVERLSVGNEKQSPTRLAGLLANFRRITKLRSALAAWRPDSVISFGDRTNVLAIVAARLLGLRIVVSERSEFYACDIGGRLWERLRKISYPHAHKVVFQTREVAERFCHERASVTFDVIGNPIAEEFTRPVDREQDNIADHCVVAMGRLSHEKGFDILLEAFKQIASDVPNWNLAIFGEGPCREALEARRSEYELISRVHMPGRTEFPARDLAKADIFVLSSRFEGMPNVMLEAMALGVPVVAVNCSAGVRELSKNGQRALLVPRGDVVALGDTMRQLMKDPGRRAVLGRTGREVLAEYDTAVIVARWRSVCASSELDGAAESTQ
jgi:glycosyltransferase involved in cell wall biosynthesis